MSESLIQAGKEQMELLASTEMPDAIFEEAERAGDYTGERLFRRAPEKYRLVVSLLAERVGLLKIGELLSLNWRTVAAVRDREKIPIAMEKEQLSRAAYGVAGLALEGLKEDLSDPARRRMIPARDKAIIAGVAVDKGQLLAGEATARLEVTEIQTPEHDDFNRYVAGLAGVRSATHGDGGAAAQKGAGDLRRGGANGAGPGAVGPVVEIEAADDVESEGNGQNGTE